jgi:hypothetical protein
MSITMPKITVSGARMTAGVPYNTKFISAAKKLGGKWVAPDWVFDARDEQRVRDLCRDIYGSDGITSDLVTLRIEWRSGNASNQSAFTVYGRVIATAFGRDSGAKLGDGIVLLAGAFSSGGSVKNWETTVGAGTVVLVRDFPRAAAINYIAKQTENDRRIYSIEIEEALIDRDALTAERDRLMARLTEINRLLGE